MGEMKTIKEMEGKTLDKMIFRIKDNLLIASREKFGRTLWWKYFSPKGDIEWREKTGVK